MNSIQPDLLAERQSPQVARRATQTRWRTGRETVPWHIVRLALLMLVTAGIADRAEGVEASGVTAEIVDVRKIWEAAPHNAFTDLVRWRDRFYCAFREGQGHAGDIGRLRVIVSEDGMEWSSAALLATELYDLRDAALSVTPDDRLMVLGGAQQDQNGARATGTFVSLTQNGRDWSAPQIVIPLGRWLWRVTWHGAWAYGVSYAADQGRPFSALHRTRDGIHYESVVPQLLGEGGWPTEARIRFAPDATAYCLHRRDGEQGNSAYLGSAAPPYTSWTWRDLKVRLGGPNFLLTPRGVWIAAGRFYEGGPRTELAILDVEQGELVPLLRLPSGGDTSYPGMVWYDDSLWVSYYSSHEERTSIYMARVRLRQTPP